MNHLEQARVEALGAFFGETERARELARRGVSYRTALKIFFESEFAKEVRVMERPNRPYDFLDLTKREIRKYSFLGLIDALQSRDSKRASFEFECSQEIANRYGKPPNGAFVPRDIWARDLVMGTDTAGGYLVGTDLLGDQFIEALRARLVTGRLGARILDGLVGDVAIPGLSTGTSVYWVAESGAPSEGSIVFKQIQLSPKTVGTYLDISRKLLLQSSPAADDIVRNDLLIAILTEIDRVAINGGGANQPVGILQTAGIGTVSLGTNGDAPTWAAVVNLVKEVAIDNALMGNLAYLTNAHVVAKLRTTAKVASTDSVMIMNGEQNTLMGYPVEQTSLVPSDLTKGTGTDLSAMIFGNFNDLVIGEWGTLDVLVDPYTGGTSGQTRVVGLMDVDVAVRHPESFAAITDMVTS